MRLSLLLTLAACSDYDLNQQTKHNGADSGDSGFNPGGGGGSTGECGALGTDAGDVGIDETCEALPVGTFTPIIEWTNTTVGDAYATPVVGQLTDDNGNGVIDGGDTPDVVVSNAVGVTYALRGDTGTIIWSAGNMGAEPMTPAIGDVDGDGWPDVVAAGSSGTAAFSGQTGTQIWTQAPYSGGHTPPCGAVGLYDLDSDGSVEVVIGREIRNGKTGAIKGKGKYGDGSGHSWAAPMGAAADIDQDGQLEVVVGNALYRSDGTEIWYNGKSDGFVAVANFDSDDFGEIVVADQGSVRLQDDDGTVIWTRSGIAGATVGPPTVADYDGDGEPEIGVAGNGTYIVLETDGSTKWTRSTQDYSSGFTGSAVFDFEGDGSAEVVYADENDLFVYDGATGAIKLDETQHSSATCSEYPSIADVDGDGHAEIIYTSSTYSGPERGVTVVGDASDSWMPARLVWNQHAYAITNVDDNGFVPKKPDTNWLTYNSFRSADLASSTGGATTDAVPVLVDSCPKECDAGKLWISVAIGNQGTEPMPAGVPIDAWALQGGNPVWLSTQYTTAEVEPGGASDGMIFEIDAAQLTDGVLQFIADDDNGKQVLTECNEDNNTLRIEKGLCP